MDLHITVSGLCLIVTPSTADAIHVLLPSTPYSIPGGGNVHKHDPQLELGSGVKPIDLTDSYIDFRGIRGKGNLVVEPPFEVLRVGSTWTIDPSQWGVRPSSAVACRITLPPAVQIDHGSTAEYEILLDTTSVGLMNLTNQVTCQFHDVDMSYFDSWAHVTFGKKGTSTPLPKPPASTSPTRISITHEPHHSMGNLKKGEEATHFQAFYQLFGVTASGRIHAKLHKEKITSLGANPYNCMLGGAPGGP
jgi:hypothetical protein